MSIGPVKPERLDSISESRAKEFETQIREHGKSNKPTGLSSNEDRYYDNLTNYYGKNIRWKKIVEKGRGKYAEFYEAPPSSVSKPDEYRLRYEEKIEPKASTTPYIGKDGKVVTPVGKVTDIKVKGELHSFYKFRVSDDGKVFVVDNMYGNRDAMVTTEGIGKPLKMNELQGEFIRKNSELLNNVEFITQENIANDNTDATMRLMFGHKGLLASKNEPIVLRPEGKTRDAFDAMLTTPNVQPTARMLSTYPEFGKRIKEIRIQGVVRITLVLEPISPSATTQNPTVSIPPPPALPAAKIPLPPALLAAKMPPPRIMGTTGAKAGPSSASGPVISQAMSIGPVKPERLDSISESRAKEFETQIREHGKSNKPTGLSSNEDRYYDNLTNYYGKNIRWKKIVEKGRGKYAEFYEAPPSSVSKPDEYRLRYEEKIEPKASTTPYIGKDGKVVTPVGKVTDIKVKGELHSFYKFRVSDDGKVFVVDNMYGNRDAMVTTEGIGKPLKMNELQGEFIRKNSELLNNVEFITQENIANDNTDATMRLMFGHKGLLASKNEPIVLRPEGKTRDAFDAMLTTPNVQPTARMLSTYPEFGKRIKEIRIQGVIRITLVLEPISPSATTQNPTVSIPPPAAPEFPFNDSGFFKKNNIEHLTENRYRKELAERGAVSTSNPRPEGQHRLEGAEGMPQLSLVDLPIIGKIVQDHKIKKSLNESLPIARTKIENAMTVRKDPNLSEEVALIEKAYFGQNFNRQEQLHNDLFKLKQGLEKINIDNFKFSSDAASTTVAALDTNQYQMLGRNPNAKVIHVGRNGFQAYYELMGKSKNAVADVLIHELSHGELNSLDFVYIGTKNLPNKGDVDVYELINLGNNQLVRPAGASAPVSRLGGADLKQINNIGIAGPKSIKNADSLAQYVSLLDKKISNPAGFTKDYQTLQAAALQSRDFSQRLEGSVVLSRGRRDMADEAPTLPRMLLMVGKNNEIAEVECYLPITQAERMPSGGLLH
ncbi:hypothetical protein V1956_24460 [Yersinia sp. 2540 StPb PI]|uniref:hypothetical protein n=1 Tax=Yersinia sp. 2540 StPb PI TaxID=3117406 RepID=UPI003FA44457